MDNDILDFDQETLFTKVFKVGGKVFLLEEASGAAAVKYRNEVMNRIKLADNKLQESRNLADVEPFLVSLCCFDYDLENSLKGKPVGVEVVRSWPNRVVKTLYDLVREKSQLVETKEEDQGKSGNGTIS